MKTNLDGYRASALLSAWNRGDTLSTEDLEYLEEVLKFLITFNVGFAPLCFYYSTKCASVHSALEARLGKDLKWTEDNWKERMTAEINERNRQEVTKGRTKAKRGKAHERKTT